MLNGYLQAINAVLYETFSDQVITQSDGKIQVEHEFSDAVKELL